jgi:hypothetical protein
MWHVDEGALHAWLDDALDALPEAEVRRIREHLSGCGECARRLEEARTLRAEARAVLAWATPDLRELPTLEELRQRARGGAGRGATGVHLRRLGWAASVVLAVGAGWLLRGGWPRAGVAVAPGPSAADPGRAVGAVGEAPAAESPPLRETATLRGSPAAAVPPARTATGGPGPASPGAPPVRDEAAAARRLAASTSSKPIRTEDAPAAAPEARDAGGRVAARALVDSLDRQRATPLFPPVPVDALARQLAPRADSSVEFADRMDASRGRGVTLNAAGVPPGDREVSRLAIQPLRVSGGRDSTRAATTPLSPELSVSGSAAGAQRTAARAPDPRPAAGSLVVPGLEVLDVAWLDHGDAPVSGVRVLQLLESGDTLEMVYLPPGAQPSRLPRIAADGRTELVVARAGGWLVARARVPRESLEALIRRLPDPGR